MNRSVLSCGISRGVARLSVKPERGEPSTAVGQDKSRSLRRGRVADERRHIKHFERGAIAHDSLRVGKTSCRIITSRTSRGFAP
jgi:hypothetical protein